MPEIVSFPLGFTVSKCSAVGRKRASNWILKDFISLYPHLIDFYVSWTLSSLAEDEIGMFNVHIHSEYSIILMALFI